MSWVFVFFCGFLFFFLFHFHYLFLLLGLEFLVLSLFYGMSFLLNFSYFNGMLVFLIVLVCMGGVGLSILVFLVRGRGVDLFLFF